MNQSSGNSTTWHKSQVFALMLAGVISGIAWVSLFGLSGLLFSSLLIAAVALIILGIKRDKFLLAAAACLAFTVGAWRFQSEAALQSNLIDMTNSEASVQAYGYVDGDFVSKTAGRGQFFFRVLHIKEGDNEWTTDERVLVLGASIPEYHYGDFLVIEGRIREPGMIEDFNYPAYLRVSGVFVTFLAKDIRESDVYESITCRGCKYAVPIWRVIFGVRDAFAQAVERSVAEPAAGYVKGILLGLRADLPADMKEAFARTGTSHVLAISGYNITIIAKYLMEILVCFMRRQRAIWVVGGGLILFTVMTGASASVVRAAVMGIVVLVASGVGRLSDAKQVLLLAAGVMAMLNPYVVRFDTGFQLSFAAVAGLIFIQPLLEPIIRKVLKKGFLADLVSATVAAQIAVAPLLALYFGSVSVILLPANLLVLPFIPATMLLGFLTGVSGFIWLLPARAMGLAVWALAQWQISAITYLGGLSWAAVSMPLSGWMVVAIYAAMVLCVWILTHRRGIQNLQP